MSHPKPETIYLKDYQKPHYTIERINLTFVLDDTSTHVTNLMQVRKESAENFPLVLDGENLELESVTLNGVALHKTEYELSSEHLILHNLPQTFTLEIMNRINPIENKALDGLYKSGGIFCTQNEPQGFRRITYYLDRPDVMAVFQTKIIAKKAENPVLLSNGNLIESGDLDAGYHYAVWEDPFPKPCYLYALVAGDLALVEDRYTTVNGRQIDLKIYCDIGNESKCLHAMQSLKASMKWDEERFDREYDLDIYMIVAVDSFNMGAMENKGLNIFNSHYVLADQETATDNDFLGIESVIGHEYFHNWTGNRITCRDWFQLTLKEGLTVFRDQSFSADLNDPVVQRISDVAMLRMRQFVEDASATSHPIKPDHYIEINNFYTATVYEKGAEVIRMLQTLLGRDGFKKGMDLYFETFDGQAVTTEAFIWAMSEANGFDLSQFERWYSQSGTPQLKVEKDYQSEHKRFTVTLKQQHKGSEPLFFPQRIALFDHSGKEIKSRLLEAGIHLKEDVYIISEPEHTLTFEGVESEPVLSINRGFSAPVKVEMQQSNEELAFIMAHDSDDFNRYEASQEFAMIVMKKCYGALINQEQMQVPAAFIDAFGALLKDHRISKALKAKMLEIPAIDLLMQELDNIAIKDLYRVRNYLLNTIATELESLIWNEYDAIEDSSYSVEAAAMGQRALKNRLLELIAPTQSERVYTEALKRYHEATNMTDRFAMLRLFSNVAQHRESVTDSFYKQFHTNTLVMNKYLSVMASSELEGTLETVIALQDDPVYDNIVPNLVRALIGSFARNHLYFHAEDGSGYRFIAEKIIAIDLFNPQIASGLAGAFKNYERMNQAQQLLMRESLEHILSVEGLSKNVYEIVSKILHKDEA